MLTVMAKQRVKKRSVLSSPFIKPILGVFFLFWLMTGFIITVDPYDIYDWGSAPILLKDYNRSEVDYLYGAVSRADVDILLIGGSTLAPIKSIDLVEAFPGASTAFNFSPSGPRPFDREIILKLVNENSPADHLIVGLDWIYVLPRGLSRTSFPSYLYDSSLSNDLRILTTSSFTLAVRKLLRRPLALQGWDYETRQDIDKKRFSTFQSKKVSSLLDSIQGSYAEFNKDQSFGCDEFSTVTQVLMPMLKEFVSTGRRVDIIIPPFSLAQYYTWSNRDDQAASLAKPFLERQVAMRRCVTEIAASQVGIRIFAFDNVASITSNLSNYRDPMHLYNQSVIRKMLDDVASGKNELTLKNLDTYSKELFDRVVSFSTNNYR